MNQALDCLQRRLTLADPTVGSNMVRLNLQTKGNSVQRLYISVAYFLKSVMIESHLKSPFGALLSEPFPAFHYIGPAAFVTANQRQPFAMIEIFSG